ncbi:MAG: hypothetical protein NC483_00515 [Ruminococcus sp.]|nr:hypothetical protein [Ruminococcus sp.]
MKHKELLKLLKQVKIPVAYDHFSDNKIIEPPFMAYREQSPNNFRADNKVYSAFSNFEIELVTSKKDVELETKISDLLTDNNIPYEKTQEIWDSTEKIYHIFYEI